MKTSMLFMAVVVALVLALGAGPASAVPAWDPCEHLNISMNPTSGPVSTNIAFSGSGLISGTSISILWDGTGILSFSGNVASAFGGGYTVPANAAPGPHTVTFNYYDYEEVDGSCNAIFTVTSSTTPGVTTEQPGVTGSSTPATQSTGTTTTSTGSLPSTGLPLLPVAALALGGLGLSILGWRRR